MELPEDLRYTSTDQWIRLDGGEAVIGITDYAQDQLGDIIFFDLPEVGHYYQGGEAFGMVESAKAVSDLYVPVAGEVIAVNETLNGSPEIVNDSPYDRGWVIRIRVDDPSEFEALLTAEAYRAQLDTPE